MWGIHYPIGQSIDPSLHLTRICIDFVLSISAPSYAILTVPSSKTDPFRKGVAISIARAPGAHTCTVSALKSLFEYSEQSPESPLFTEDDGTPLARGQFISEIKESLLKAGYDPSELILWPQFSLWHGIISHGHWFQ